MEAPEQLQRWCAQNQTEPAEPWELKRQCIEASSVMETDASNARVPSQLWRTVDRAAPVFQWKNEVSQAQAHVYVSSINPCIGSSCVRMAMLRDATHAGKHAYSVRSLETAERAGTAVSFTCGIVCSRFAPDSQKVLKHGISAMHDVSIASVQKAVSLVPVGFDA